MNMKVACMLAVVNVASGAGQKETNFDVQLLQTKVTVENKLDGAASDDASEKPVLSKILQIYEKIDDDDDGQLSLQELQNGAQRNPDLLHVMRLLDFDKTNLERYFVKADVDQSGTITPQEVHEVLTSFDIQLLQSNLSVETEPSVAMEDRAKANKREAIGGLDDALAGKSSDWVKWSGHEAGKSSNCRNLGCFVAGSLDECQNECEWQSGCNLINYCSRGASCRRYWKEGRCCKRECDGPDFRLVTSGRGWDVYSNAGYMLNR